MVLARLRLAGGETVRVTLAEQVRRKLILAGYTYDSPALTRVREWNRAACAKAAGCATPGEKVAGRGARGAGSTSGG